MRVTNKLRFNRRNWKPDSYPLHRIDIFMVNGAWQMLVWPAEDGVPRFDDGIKEHMTAEDIAWCHDENRALLEIFPEGHGFWTGGI